MPAAAVAGPSLLDQHSTRKIMSQASIEGMMLYIGGSPTCTPGHPEGAALFDTRHVPRRQSSLSFEVVSHLFEEESAMSSTDPGGGGGDALFELIDISTDSTDAAMPTSLMTGLPTTITDTAPRIAEEAAAFAPFPPRTHTHTPTLKPRAKKERPLTKRKLRELEAERTMSPEKFRKWREYREKNNLSVQKSRRRKRDRLQQQATGLHRETLRLQERASALETTAGDLMDRLAYNVQ